MVGCKISSNLHDKATLTLYEVFEPETDSWLSLLNQILLHLLRIVLGATTIETSGGKRAGAWHDDG